MLTITPAPLETQFYCDDLPYRIEFYIGSLGATLFAPDGRPLAHVRPGHKPRAHVQTYGPPFIQSVGVVTTPGGRFDMMAIVQQVAIAQAVGLLPGKPMLSAAGRWLNSSVQALRDSCRRFETPRQMQEVA